MTTPRYDAETAQQPLADVMREIAHLPPDEILNRLRQDQRERWRRGERVLAESYLKLLSDRQMLSYRSLELVYCEYLLREELGEKPDLAEYAQRFPEYAMSLQRQLRVRHLVRGNRVTPPPPPPKSASEVDTLPMSHATHLQEARASEERLHQPVSSLRLGRSTIQVPRLQNLVQEEVRKLRDSLADLLERNAFEEAREVVERILKLEPADSDALEAKQYLDEVAPAKKRAVTMEAAAAPKIETAEQKQSPPAAAFAAEPEATEEITCRTYDAKHVILSAVFIPKTKYILSGGADQSVRIWDLKTGETTQTLQSSGIAVKGVAVSSDGKYVLATGKSIRLWEVGSETSREIRRFTAFTGEMTCVAFSHDEQFVLAGTRGKTLHVWDFETAKELKQLSNKHRAPVVAIAMHPSLRRLISCGADHTFLVWGYESRSNYRRFEVYPDEALCAAWDAFTDTAIVGLSNGKIGIFHVERAEQIGTLEGHQGPVTALAISRDGQLLASGGADATIRLWDLAKKKQTVCLTGHNGPITSLAISGHKTNMLSCSQDKTFRVWKLPKTESKSGALDSILR
ncbi:MAG: hypothetical protein KatS3mg105_3734 [Gemmatales bacterium]|nr:MAG: hypothetical protein KatS3mg105_3734 [Gemmatales bacterium]